jgi:spore maturation protein CgeB
MFGKSVKLKFCAYAVITLFVLSIITLTWSRFYGINSDGLHLKYFDTAEEFFELADWYLKHEDERIKIANSGMERAHAEFSGGKIAKYTLDVIESGSYDAPWNCSG